MHFRIEQHVLHLLYIILWLFFFAIDSFWFCIFCRQPEEVWNPLWTSMQSMMQKFYARPWKGSVCFSRQIFKRVHPFLLRSRRFFLPQLAIIINQNIVVTNYYTVITNCCLQIILISGLKKNIFSSLLHYILLLL